MDNMDTVNDVDESSCGSDIEDDIDESITSDSETKAADKRFDALPKRSMKTYLGAFKKFKDWMDVNKIESCTEDALLQYFESLSVECKPSTLWAVYSMLNITCKSFMDVNIAKFDKVRNYLKKKSFGYKSKKSRALSPSQIEKFINEAPDDRYLVTKIIMIFGITGACRRLELCNLTMNDIIDRDGKLIISIPKTENYLARSFVISGYYYRLCKEYMALRPDETLTNRFFVNYQHGRCTRQVIGINKIGRMPKEVAKYLNLPFPEEYTGNSFRSSSSTLLTESCPSIRSLRNHSGWKLVKINEANESMYKKIKVSNEIAESMLFNTHEKLKTDNGILYSENSKDSLSFDDLPKKSNDTIKTIQVTKNFSSDFQKNLNTFSGCPLLCKKILLNFTNCSNVTINVNYKKDI